MALRRDALLVLFSFFELNICVWSFLLPQLFSILFQNVALKDKAVWRDLNPLAFPLVLRYQSVWGAWA